MRVNGTTVISSVTSGTLADATDGVGNVVFSNQFFGSGSGKYTALFRIQANGNEQGYNSYNGTPMDQKNGVGEPETVIGPVAGTSVSELEDARINVGGVLYYQFTLDLDEQQNLTDRWISLDNVAIYTTPRTTDPGYTSLAQMNADSQLNPIWRMDFGSTNNSILLNANLAPGSGHDNMVMLVPVSLFAGAAATDHVYIYTQFGVFNSGGVTTEIFNGSSWQNAPMVSDATFEEWSLYTENAIPEPASAGLLGLGLLVYLWRGKRSRKSS